MPRAGSPSPIEISHGQQVHITVGGIDPDGDLIAVSVMAPSYGRFAWHSEPKGDGYGMWVDVTYEPPDPCWTGRDAFAFVVCDAHGYVAQGQVQITVVNRPPRLRKRIERITVVAYEVNLVSLPEATDPDPGDQEALQYKILLNALPTEVGAWTGTPPSLTFVAQATCLPIVLPYEVRDPCGARDGGIVVIQVLHRPVVRGPTGSVSVFCGRSDAFAVYVDDHDFFCGTLELVLGEDVILYEEEVSLHVAAASGSSATISPKALRKGAECTVTYAPNPGVRYDELTILAVDKGGRSSPPLRVPVMVDRPPAPLEVPSLVKVRPGETVKVSLSARDLDRDTVTVTKTAGPGALVGNTYTWTVEDPYWGPSWRTVEFVLEDRCGGRTRQSLNIRVLQPPRVYGGYATIPRGGTVTASLYVFDPDTPAKDLAFSFSPPKGITVHLLRVEDPPYYYGSYYGYTARVAVSVDRHLCPGSYAVPFKVSDGDYTESGTLQVRVVGNRPPVGQAVAARAAVVLTPGGIEARPVLVGPLVATDPEGDRVILAGVVADRYGWADGINPTARTFLFRPHVSLAEACSNKPVSLVSQQVGEDQGLTWGGARMHRARVAKEPRAGGWTRPERGTRREGRGRRAGCSGMGGSGPGRGAGWSLTSQEHPQ